MQHETRFDIAALRRATDDTIFKRGEAYHQDEAVSILSIDDTRVLSRVEGSETYRVEVVGRGAKLEGTCSCPAFEDWGVCKHMVATALAANAVGPGDAAGGAIGRIRTHLAAEPVDTLVGMIVECALIDSALFERLDLAATTRGTDDTTLEKRLRAKLDKALRIDGYQGYGGAAGWAENVSRVLDAVDDLVGRGGGEIALRLADHALDEVAEVVEELYDENGECVDVLRRARAIHLAAALAARPDPIGLAQDLFEREMHDDWGIFVHSARHYADALGAPGLAALRAMAEEAWAELPAQGKSRDGRTGGHDYGTLVAILDVFAERDGDLDARIALRSKNLSSTSCYVGLVAFCRSNGRRDEALRHAEEGLRLFEDDRPDERLLFLTVELLVEVGREADAVAHLRRAFERQPTMALYERLRGLAGEGGRDEAIAILEALAARKQRGTYVHPADLLVKVLAHERMFEAAWAAVARYDVSVFARRDLAAASEEAAPRQALATHAAHVEDLVGHGGSSYDAAAALIQRMAKLQDAATHAAYVDDLKTRHRRKRNFMKLLA